eukprot:PhF_6_TR32181/c0_g1_i1/m.47770
MDHDNEEPFRTEDVFSACALDMQHTDKDPILPPEGTDVNPALDCLLQDAAPPVRKAKDQNCGRCGNTAQYTCPKCEFRSCSLECVRQHKSESGCPGVRLASEWVPLPSFNTCHIRRDYTFLEDVRRVIDNNHRAVPAQLRFNHKVLPPPLYALSKGARAHGVVLQIMSEGMHKRKTNTSRYNPRYDTITWKIEFNLHHPDGTIEKISTDWGNERFKLGELFQRSWEKNPELKSFPIRKGYNKAGRWLSTPGGSSCGDSVAQETSSVVASSDVMSNVGDDIPSGDEEELVGDDVTPEGNNNTVGETNTMEGGNASVAAGEGGEGGGDGGEGVISPPTVITFDDPNDGVFNEDKHKLLTFMEKCQGIMNFYMKAERLGTRIAYYKFEPEETIHENLRSSFFIVEYPVIEVVPACTAEQYPLITEDQRIAVRESFRKRPREEKPFDPSTRSELPCPHYRRGECRRGERCPRTHYEEADLPLCRSVLRGFECQIGEKCLFSHDASRAPPTTYMSRGRGRGGFSRGGGPPNNNRYFNPSPGGSPFPSNSSSAGGMNYSSPMSRSPTSLGSPSMVPQSPVRFAPPTTLPPLPPPSPPPPPPPPQPAHQRSIINTNRCDAPPPPGYVPKYLPPKLLGLKKVLENNDNN